ncbi:MAG: hypothetical protein AAFV47_08955 [Pseudomonadota bacterium]
MNNNVDVVAIFRPGGFYDWHLKEKNDTFTFSDVYSKIEYIPWEFSLDFHAIELGYERTRKSNPAADDPKDLDSESLFGTLASGRVDNGAVLRRVSYSLFGSQDRIEDFSFCLYPNDDRPDGCILSGCYAYQYSDGSSRLWSNPDSIGFELSIDRSLFNAIRDSVVNGEGPSITLQLKGVHGFYAQETHTAETGDIKVLLHEVYAAVANLPEDSGEKVLRLGQVSELTINVGWPTRTVVTGDTERDCGDSEDESDAGETLAKTVAAQRQQFYDSLINHLQHVRLSLQQAMTPLWVCAVSLVLVVVLTLIISA